MNVRVWGCRGSLATPGPATLRYGGNTSCVEVRSNEGAVVVLDAGTGIRELGASLVERGVAEVDLLLTHLHLDHLEGLSFFAPLHDPGCLVRVWGPRPADEGSLREHVMRWISPPYFPVPFDQLFPEPSFTEVLESTWQIGGLHVSSSQVEHPGSTVGFRLEEAGRALAYIPDNEADLGGGGALELGRGADVVFHDAQFTAEEYSSRTRWGHSSLGGFADLVRAAAPGRAFMFHHDPSHADEKLEEMLVTARRLTGQTPVELARDGLELRL